ncbi:MAG: translation initiation factor [Flavobacteriaceae bacterium]|nr:translation initiation factor [Flavobacteriaceae bacterium]|tara:strand:- start:1689 stop:2039 length:351 start_codon:yes stop_codon:yes gene_type:complete
MTKKTLNSFELLGKVKFENLSPDNEDSSPKTKKETFTQQNLEAHFSNKGRAGKVVTIIKGFKGNSDQLKALAKDIKLHASTGGSVKKRDIIIQGDLRDKIISFLIDMGHNVKRVGG